MLHSGKARVPWALASMLWLTVACGDDAVPGESSESSGTIGTASTTEAEDTGEPIAAGHANGAFVNAGHHAMTSPGHRLLFTFGQSSMNQGTMTSPHYRLVGGLVPATQ